MRTGGREARAFALSGLMDVHGMLSGGQVLEIQLDRYSGATFTLGQYGSADTLVLSIFEIHGFAGCVPDGDSQKTRDGNGENLVSHFSFLLIMNSRTK
jgi:hypothetical protein